MPADAASRGRLLVVDDDRLVLATLVHGLAQAGFEVIDADNGDDAILLAREHRPELALLDIRMEGKSGFDVAHYLRAHGATPFMFLSAFADRATIERVEALGALDYLVKPLDIGQVVERVGRALAARRGTAPPEPPVATPAISSAVAMAAGVLMQRHTLARGPALARLQQMAADAGRALADEAEAVLAEVEKRAPPRPR